ncbi:MAG: hypothetical protein JWO19_3951 [Bryobacterales bacterium]|jgi:hypothetical protein|nr:hypothetical protein [Bryobacterales bacterium]
MPLALIVSLLVLSGVVLMALAGYLMDKSVDSEERKQGR